MTELKPCPFCGGEAVAKNNEIVHKIYDPNTFAVIDVEYGEGNMFWVECRECYATSGAEDDEETAAAAWNRRAEDAELQKYR